MTLFSHSVARSQRPATESLPRMERPAILPHAFDCSPAPAARRQTSLRFSAEVSHSQIAHLEATRLKNIFVGNLDFNTSEEELRQMFEAYGQVDRVSIMTDRDTGRSRGFGFVEMTNASEADKAIAALNGTDLGGRALKINEAQPKTDRPRAGGGGGGKRFGGGGGGGRDDYQAHARQPREPRW